jgi:hypothetical protein
MDHSLTTVHSLFKTHQSIFNRYSQSTHSLIISYIVHSPLITYHSPIWESIINSLIKNHSITQSMKHSRYYQSLNHSITSFRFPLRPASKRTRRQHWWLTWSLARWLTSGTLLARDTWRLASWAASNLTRRLATRLIHHAPDRSTNGWPDTMAGPTTDQWVHCSGHLKAGWLNVQ